MTWFFKRREHRGYTLVELLVVVTIAIILMAAALPVARTVMEDAKVREASRQLNSYFALARTRAMSTGRPCGLWLEIDRTIDGSASSDQVTRLYIVESTEPYGGSTLPSANAFVNGSGLLEFSDANEATYLQNLVEDGDTFLVRFGYKGDWFSFRRNGATFSHLGSVLGTTSPPGSPGKPFQVLRLPQRSGSARQLAAGAAIDLHYSGAGTSGADFRNFEDRLLIVFGPGGEVSSISGRRRDGSGNLNAYGPTPAAGTLHFLIGPIENTGNGTVATSNLADPTALWVSVGRTTGAVATSENLYAPVLPSNSSPTEAQLIEYARQAAINREQMGGR